MSRSLRLLIVLVIAAGAHAADDADPPPGPTLEGQVFSVRMQGQPKDGFLVFGHSQVAWVGEDAPDALEEGDTEPGADSGVMWMPYSTRDLGGGKIGFNSKAWGEFGGTVVGDTLMASWSNDGQIQMEVKGKRSERRFAIRPQTAHGKPLADARQLEAAGKRREAIDAYAKVIDADRFDLPQSAPALVALVRCCQALKDDQGVQARWQELSKKYLGSPPPLDGATKLELATAQEELLWKPWTGDELLRVTVNQVDAHRTLRDHTVTAGTTIQLSAVGDRHQHLSFERADAGAEMMMAAALQAQAQAAAAKADAKADQPESGDQAAANGKSQEPDKPEAVGIDADGHEHASKSVQAWGGAGTTQVSVEFDELPADVRKFKRLALTLVATQDREWEFKEVALKEGEGWETDDAAYKITSVAGADGEWNVGLVETRKQGGAGRHSSMAMAGFGGDSEFTVEDERGVRLASHGMSSSGDGKKTTYQFRYASAAKPVKLKQRIVTKTSTRTLHVAVEDVELP